METFFIKAAQFLLSLSILIFIHELGHFLWARLFKVRVEKFYLFFDAYGKALWRWKPRGSDTEYGIGWLPFGGYCKIAGMVDESMDKEQMAAPPQPWEYRTQAAWKRMLIISGGVINNLLLAIIIYIGIIWCNGTDELWLRSVPQGMAYSEYAQSLGFRDGDVIWAVDGREVGVGKFHSALLLSDEVTVRRDGALVSIAMPDSAGEYFLREAGSLSAFAAFRYPMVVDSVVAGGVAASAGFLVGDSIVAVGGVPTLYGDEVRTALRACAGDTTTVTCIQAGDVVSRRVAVSAEGTIGIYVRPMTIDPALFTHTDYTLWAAIPAGAVRGWEMLRDYVRQFKLVFTKEGAKSVGGFGTMGSIFPTAWDWRAFWSLTAFFSVALAFMNILPIPALDGGHLFFVIGEVITRRKPSEKMLEWAQYIGFAFIIALIVLVNANDIYKFIIKPLIE